MTTPRYARRRERGFLAALGRLFSELRSPTTTGSKVLAAALAALLFALLVLVVLAGFFLSRVLRPVKVAESVDPTTFLRTAETLEFQTRDGRTHSGWFFPGLRGGPVVVVCHGYRSSRSEMLSLATSLQQNRYNVFTFNFAGHGDSPVGYTTLGYRESQELLAALEMLATRTDVDTKRIGLWGYSLGGYAALSAAPAFPGVKAVVVDSVYQHPTTLLHGELDRLGANVIPLLGPITILQFRLFALFQRGQDEPAEALRRLEGVPKLFIAGEDMPDLAETTRELHQQAPAPKELKRLPRSSLSSLSEEERRTYENLVISFFFRHLPLIRSRS